MQSSWQSVIGTKLDQFKIWTVAFWLMPFTISLSWK